MNDAYKGYAYDYVFAVAQHDSLLDDRTIGFALADDMMDAHDALFNAMHVHKYGYLPFDDLDDY